MTPTTDALDLIKGEPVEEIPLRPTPLARVVAQARFEQMGIFKLDNPIAGLIRPMIDSGYPLYDEGYEKNITVGPSGLTETDSSNPLWRFKSADQAWIATITPISVALETSAYTSRTDFVNRFTHVMSAFEQTVGRSTVSRLGIRYTNLVVSTTNNREELADFFEHDLRGPLNLSPGGTGLRHGLNDAAVAEGSQGIQGKWGILPSGVIFDPSFAPTSEATALLDIDSFREQVLIMDSDTLASELKILSEAAYRLFRRVISSDYIRANKVSQ